MKLLTILVVTFSVIFPFLKLAVLYVTLLVRCPGDKLWLALRFVGKYGKWSLLDVFLVCLILVLTSGQIFVAATPDLGIPLFILAVMISLITGEWLEHHLQNSAAIPVLSSNPAKIPSAVQLSTLLAAGLFLFIALIMPYLEIRDWRLSNRGHSLLGSIWSLWQEGTSIAAISMAFFCIVIPVGTWIGLLRTCIVLRRSRNVSPQWHYITSLGLRWNGLPVFALALVIFLAEGDYLLSSQPGWGSFAILAVIAFFQGSLTLNRNRLSPSSEEPEVDQC